jgi:hypothetical protein
MGKEKDFGNAAAPLADIVVLRQAAENSIRQIPPRESVLEIYQQFLNLGDDPEEVRAMGKLESTLLDHIPVWLLENRGDEASARLTYQTLSDYEAMNHENI